MATIATLVQAGVLSPASAREQVVTWDETDRDTSIILGNGNRDALCIDSSFSAVRATRGNNSGKRYFEISVPTLPGSSRAGFADKDFTLSTYLGNARISAGITGGSPNINGGGVDPQMAISTAITPTTLTAGQYYQFAIDFSTGKAWIGANNTWMGSGNPAAGTNPWLTGVPGAMWPACSLYSDGSYRIHTKLAEFSGTIPSGFTSWAQGTHNPSGFAMVGDSITHLYLTTDDWRTLSGYGTAMEYGIPSNNSTQTLTRFPNILKAKPKAVFMMIGVNDTPTGIGVSTSQSNVAAIIALAQAANVPIFVEKILPVGAAYAGTTNNTIIATLNAALQTTVNAAGSGVRWLPWVDTTPLTDPSDYHADGIHLSHAGNVKRVAALAPYFAIYG